MIRILHLEDNYLDARLIQERLVEEGLDPSIHLVATENQFLEALKVGHYDLILADFYLPGFDGLKALEIVQRYGLYTPVILISGKLGEEAAIESLQKGAIDYILKDYLQRLGPAVRRALEEHEQRQRTLAIEQELLKKAEIFRSAELIGKLGTFEWNVSEELIYLSDGLYHILEVSKEQLSQKVEEFSRFMHSEDLPIFEEFYARLLEDPVPLTCEYRIVTLAGKVKYIRTNASSANSTPQAVLLTGVCQDISDQKMALEDLERSEEKYRTLVEQATDGILVTDDAMIIQDANASALEILEADSPELLIGQHPEVFLSEHERMHRPINLPLLRRGVAVTNVREVITFGQKSKYLEITSKRLTGGQIQTVFRDVTDREEARKDLERVNQFLDERVKQAVKEAQELAEKYRLISENSSDLITQSNAEGYLYYVSPSVEDMIGKEQQNWLGKLFCQWLPREDRQLWQATLERELPRESKVARDSFTLQHRMRHASGQLLWVETVCKGIRNEHGTLMTIQTASRDIHLRKQAEEEAHKALVRERELNELRAHFVSVASHQFRTPLTVISSNVQLMELIGIDRYDPRIGQAIRRISNEITRLTELMNDILILGKLNTKRLRASLERVAIDSLIHQLIDTHFSQQEDQRQVITAIPTQLPDVLLDPGLTEHILINLLTNAFKYSPQSPNPVLHVSLEAHRLMVRVRDWGVGVPPEDRENLFQSFYRASNVAHYPGTGLGLVIAKEFVDLQRGDIGYEPMEDGGSTFWFSIPQDDL